MHRTLLSGTLGLSMQYILKHKKTHTLWILKHKKTHTLWKHPTSYSYQSLFLSFFFGRWSYSSVSSLAGEVTRLSEVNGDVPLTIYLTSWPWPLTYDIDLLTWPRYASTWPPCQNSSMYVRPSGEWDGRTHTDRHTQRRCQNYYTHHVRDVGCNNIISEMTVEGF